MTKESRVRKPVVNVARARQLCTEPELRLVQASRPETIGELTETQLKSKIARARALRDKWQDVATRQRRDVQRKQKTRAVTPRDRSEEKSTLFAAVLARFQAQLDEGASATVAPGAGSHARPSKEKRGRQHRRTRSRVKQDLAEHLSARESERARRQRPASRYAASKPERGTPQAPEQAATTGRPPARSAKKAPKEKATSGRGKKQPAAPRKTRAGAPLDGRAGKHPAQPVAKRDRILATGPARRTRGHALARGQRSQARRDRRG
jgi:hypothetical protein